MEQKTHETWNDPATTNAMPSGVLSRMVPFELLCSCLFFVVALRYF